MDFSIIQTTVNAMLAGRMEVELRRGKVFLLTIMESDVKLSLSFVTLFVRTWERYSMRGVITLVASGRDGEVKVVVADDFHGCVDFSSISRQIDRALLLAGDTVVVFGVDRGTPILAIKLVVVVFSTGCEGAHGKQST